MIVWAITDNEVRNGIVSIHGNNSYQV